MRNQDLKFQVGISFCVTNTKKSFSYIYSFFSVDRCVIKYEIGPLEPNHSNVDDILKLNIFFNSVQFTVHSVWYTRLERFWRISLYVTDDAIPKLYVT